MAQFVNTATYSFNRPTSSGNPLEVVAYMFIYIQFVVEGIYISMNELIFFQSLKVASVFRNTSQAVFF